MKLYIAGPMRGYKDFNFPTFFRVAQRLRFMGYEVMNPAEKDIEMHGEDVYKSETGDLADIAHLGFDLRETLSLDLAWIAAEADGLAMLPGWEHSKGAKAELALAEALGLDVIFVDEEGLRVLDPRWQEIPDVQPEEWSTSGEVRLTSSTGGQKGRKPSRYDLIPPVPLDLLARLYGRGAEKYDDHNWAKGYDWSLSFGAMQRHAWAFWNGEDIDDELQLPHLASVAWHAFSLLEFLSDPEKYGQFDDRRKS